jgi:hypothetical protein
MVEVNQGAEEYLARMLRRVRTMPPGYLSHSVANAEWNCFAAAVEALLAAEAMTQEEYNFWASQMWTALGFEPVEPGPAESS